MTVLKLKISDNNLDQLVSYLIRELNFNYKNHSTDISILIADNSFSIIRTVRLNIIILKKEISFIAIDIIGVVKEGFIIETENRYTRRTAKVIYKYAEEHSLPIEPA